MTGFGWVTHTDVIKNSHLNKFSHRYATAVVGSWSNFSSVQLSACAATVPEPSLSFERAALCLEGSEFA